MPHAVLELTIFNMYERSGRVSAHYNKREVSAIFQKWCENTTHNQAGHFEV